MDTVLLRPPHPHPEPMADLGTIENKYAEPTWWLQEAVLANPSFMRRPGGLCLCPSAITFGNTLNSPESGKGQLKLGCGKCICLASGRLALKNGSLEMGCGSHICTDHSLQTDSIVCLTLSTSSSWQEGGGGGGVQSLRISCSPEIHRP